MSTITFVPFTHKNRDCIAIKFPYSFKDKEYIRNHKQVYWTQTHRTFYFFKKDTSMEAFTKYLIAGGFTIDKSNAVGHSKSPHRFDRKLSHFTPQKEVLYKQFISFLKGKRFSRSTVNVYSAFVSDFLRFTRDKPAEKLDANDVRLYLEWAIGTLNYAVSTHRQIISAIKHFAYFYPACTIDVEKIYMPKKDRKLPIVLSTEEVLQLLQVTKNLKHRVILAMLYGSGLRISELLSVTLKDFDFKRNLLHIQNAKGRKDRYVVIAKSLHPLLKNYYATYRPKTLFIENPNGGSYSPISVRSFLKRSCALAKIKKRVTPHTLRHSYATHLLEQGTDIRYIQELLGHSRPETTMIYTHVTQKELREILSPLDTSINQLSLPHNDDKKAFLS